MRLTFTFFLVCGCALAQRDLRVEREPGARMALVIGNDAYPKWPLANPVNDARAMADSLTASGFKVEVLLNANLRSFEQGLDRFLARVRSGDVALVYYAGHGIQLGGENYLVPVDFDAKDEADAKYVAYSASRLHERMDATGARLNILILDACRNNPFRQSRSAAGGLAAMSSGRGTLIAFATSPGRTADDNPDGKNGLFTAHLVQALREPGLSIDQVFNRVRERVYTDSRERQLPWTVSSVIGEFYFNVASQPPARPNPLASSPQGGQNPLARQAAQNPLARPRPADPPPAAPAPLDPAAATAAAAQAYDRGDYEEAIRQALEVLRANPQHKDALFVLAAGRFKNRQYDLFPAVAVQALKAGAQFPMLVGHHHTLTGLHPAALKISASSLGFDPLTFGEVCNQKAFESPIQSLTEIQVVSGNQGEIFLRVKVRDPQNRVRTLNFTDSDATVDTSGGLPRVVPSPHSAAALQSLVQVFKVLM